MKKYFSILLLLSFLSFSQQDPAPYYLKSGYIKFVSEAPLELIQAESNAVKGVIDIEKMSFAFTIPIKSFEGFNSTLQKEHFNENYMESNTFENATYTGKILDQLPTGKDSLQIRTKGKLTIHGISQERIIPVMIYRNSKDEFSIKTSFDVALADHDIDIPKLVYHKIAESIHVNMNGNFRK